MSYRSSSDRLLRGSSAALALALGITLVLVSPSLAGAPVDSGDPQARSATPPATTAPASARVTAKAGSCKGFVNRAGMTNKVIRLGNAADITGPVPGLFRDAQRAAQAYVAYFNSARTICGRKLRLDTYDTRTNAGANLSAAKAMCARNFAAIGSLSTFDSGGSGATQGCRLPDLRAASLTAARNACASCFGINASRDGQAPNSVPDYFVSRHAAATQKAAFLYLNAGDAPRIASTVMKVAQQRGFTVVYNAAVEIAEFSYVSYVNQLKSRGVRWVQFIGPPAQTIRLAQTMASADYQPEVFLVGTNAYAPSYASTGGAAVERSIAAINFLPLTANQTELNRYRTWLKRIAPKEVPTANGLFAWSAAKLFAAQAQSLGAKLTRATLNTRLRSVNTWTGGGLHVPMKVGSKQVSPCTRLLLLSGGRWVSIGGTGYRCTGVTSVS